MFEQFTKNAIKVHMFALDEAARLGYQTVGPEHLLLGLIREGSGSASYVLEDEGVTLAACRRNTEVITGRSNQLAELERPWYKQLFILHRTEGIERPLNEEAKTALSLASAFAKECHRNVVDTGELLVGILDVPNSKVVEILRRCGADPAKIRERLTPSTSPVVITWNPLPARKLIAVGTLALIVLWLIVAGDQKDAWYVIFALFVMRLLEDYLDIFETRSSPKTGIFESKLKYFLFLNGGVAIVWLLTRILFPQGIIGIPGLVLWIGLFLLSLLTAKSAARAATRRAFKVERRSADNT